MSEDQERAGLLADPEEVRAILISSASAGLPITYSETLLLLGHHFTRPKMRSLCRVLSYVDDEAEERGEPELAVLVVRQSDGLPGQGWWVGGARAWLHRAVGGPEGEAPDPEVTKAGFRLLEGPGVDSSTQGTESHRMDSGPQLKTHKVAEDDDGIRLDRWFKRHLPDISFNVVSRWARTGSSELDGKRATPGDRIETGQTIRFPAAERGAAEPTPKRTREPLLSEDEKLRPRDGHPPGQAAFVVNKPPGLATQGGTKTHHHLDRLLDGLADDDARRGPSSSTGSTRTRRARCWSPRTARAAAFLEGFSGRTARKVYWAMVVGVPSIDDGMIELPLAKQPGTGGEKMHVDEEHGLAGADPLPGYRPRRQPRRLGRAPAADRPDPPASRRTWRRSAIRSSATANMAVPDAFLTGGISRKLHLHARRIRIDSPDGVIDVTAELPPHIAESLATIGFELMHGENMPLDTPKPSQSFEAKKRRESTAARDRRRGRRGERRSRSQAPKKR